MVDAALVPAGGWRAVDLARLPRGVTTRRRLSSGRLALSAAFGFAQPPLVQRPAAPSELPSHDALIARAGNDNLAATADPGASPLPPRRIPAADLIRVRPLGFGPAVIAPLGHASPDARERSRRRSVLLALLLLALVTQLLLDRARSPRTVIIIPDTDNEHTQITSLRRPVG